MAVKTIPLERYAQHHTTRVYGLWAGMIIATSSIVAVATFLLTQNVTVSIASIVLCAMAQLITLAVVAPIVLTPITTVSRALASITGKNTLTTPLKLRGKKYEKSDLKSVIDALYDIATRTQADTQTHCDKQQYEIVTNILNTIPLGIIALDAQRRIVYANTHAPITTDEQGDQSIQLIFEDNSLDNWLDTAKNRSIHETKWWSSIQNVLPGENNRKIYDVLAEYASTSTIETTLIVIDRTEHYMQSEDDMDFIALAAHELRGPITVIQGYLDVLEEELFTKLQKDQVALFERLKVSATRLAGYVNNILNVARYDRRHLHIHLQEDTLANIYHMIEPDMLLRASTQNRLLQVTIPQDLPTIAADRDSLSEVLSNLIDNAIKYSHEGGLVQVTATIDGHFIKCSVQDRGMGIPASVIGNLFTKFYRSHRTQQSFSGTGLGLYISKAIIESHGGSIGVRSKEGEGSVFTFSVPIYSTVADALKINDNSNVGIIHSGGGWIKNHNMYEG